MRTKIMNKLTITIGALILLLALGCSSEPAPNIEATVEARVAEALAPTSTQNPASKAVATTKPQPTSMATPSGNQESSNKTNTHASTGSALPAPDDTTNFIPVTLSWETTSEVSWQQGNHLIKEGTRLDLPAIHIQGSVSPSQPMVIDWGDGSVEEKLVGVGQRDLRSLGHVYVQDGTYSGRIKAIDTQGGESYFYFDSTILNAPPKIVEIKTPLVSLDREAQFEIEIIDPGVIDSHTLIVDWGDGSGVSSHKMESGQTTLHLRHTYVVDTGGRAYEGVMNVTDETAKDYTSGHFTAHFIESFEEISLGGPGNIGDKDALVVEIPGGGLHVFPDPSWQPLGYHGGYVPVSPNDYYWKDFAQHDPEVIGFNKGIALSEEDIFVLGTRVRNPDHHLVSCHQVAIYSIPSDSWSYPGSVPTHCLRYYSLTLLNNGRLLIMGVQSHIDPDIAEPDVSAHIYDPATQTFELLGINPLAQRVYNEYPNAIKTVELSDGRILLTSHIGTGFISLFDPSSEQFHALPVEESLQMSDICDIQPMLLKDGSVFLGGALLRPDLTTLDRLDNIDDCLLGPPVMDLVSDDGYINVPLAQISPIALSNGTILLLSSRHQYWHAWIFDGSSFRETSYRPDLPWMNIAIGDIHSFPSGDGHIIILFVGWRPGGLVVLNKFHQEPQVSLDQR